MSESGAGRDWMAHAAEHEPATDHEEGANGWADFLEHEPSPNGQQPEATRELAGPPLTIVPLAEFISVDEPSADPLLGTKDETILSAGGSIVVYGDGGAGKTTLTIDMVAHLASATPWLGFTVPRPVRIVLIENEGPRGKFRQKLDAKVATWTGAAFTSNVHVLEEPWARLSFALERHRQQLAEFIHTHGIDLVVAGPVKRLGMTGGGTPDEVSAFSDHLTQLRALLTSPLAFGLVHHENKAGEVSGAWEGEPDTLLRVKPEGRHRTILHWEKVRWGDDTHGTRMTVTWAVESKGFDLISAANDTAIVTAGKVEDALTWILTHVQTNPGQAKSTVEDAYHEHYGKGGRALARTAIQQALEAGTNGECHKALAKGPGKSPAGTYLYPASTLDSPLANPLFGEYGESEAQTPAGASIRHLAAPPKGGERDGELTSGVETEPPVDQPADTDDEADDDIPF